MTTISFNGPMCGLVTMKKTVKPFEVVSNVPPVDIKERICSWSNENHKYYNTIGCSYCSCKSFQYGNGKLCKHLIAKSVKPRLLVGPVKTMGSEIGSCISPLHQKKTEALWKSVQDYAGTYKYLGTFNFPVWVLDLSDGSSVYLFKGRKYNRWMFTDIYSEIFSERGLISTKQAYPSESITPPNDLWTEWRIWSPADQKWIQSHNVTLTS